MNICLNPIDALEEMAQQGHSAKGYWENNLPYHLKYTHRQLPTIRISTLLVDDKWVQIQMADNASDIDAEAIAKIHPPFYTTKPMRSSTVWVGRFLIKLFKPMKVICTALPRLGAVLSLSLKIP
ncbi:MULTISPECIES: hypothetical protein [unclassified Microcoleus]|uniref:hypothetical protein n=1 Tax=unclassified Microcoleus TaxID=2642155 RepID=UPI002FD62004